MRINPQQITAIHNAVSAVTPDAMAIRLFGSRLDDEARGGDVDLMIDFANPIDRPALMSARLASKVSRAIDNRKVDVVIRAPNLPETSIHRIALEHGMLI